MGDGLCPTGQYLSVPQDKFKHDNMGIPLHLRMSVGNAGHVCRVDSHMIC